MSISSATARLASPRRLQPRHMVGALLLALGLIAIIVAFEISSTTSSPIRTGARPAARDATQSRPSAQPTGVSAVSVPAGTFRDPVTHALLAVGTSAARRAASGLGHR